MNQKTTITTIVLATIMAASTVVMVLPFESAEASRESGGGDAIGGRGGDAESEGGDARVIQRGGDARTGDFEADGNNNEGNFAEGGDADGTATGGDGGTATGGAGGAATGGDDLSTDAAE